MKATIKLPLVAMLLALGVFCVASGIKWNTDLSAALKLAKKSHKPVMVDFYGEH